MPDQRHPLSGFLGPGASWTGDLSFEGRLRIDGAFQGRIYSEDVLEVGRTGRIEGEIDVARAYISGTVEGRLKVREQLVLEPSAVIRGEILMRHIHVAQGATVEATVARLERRQAQT